MDISVNRRVFVLTLASLPAIAAGRLNAAQSGAPHGGAREMYGARLEPPPQTQELAMRHAAPSGGDPLARLRYWNEVALNAVALDHTPLTLGELRIFGEQFGPTRTSRALAIVHLAILDAVNAIGKNYPCYSQLRETVSNTSIDAAIAQAAHDALIALFPSQVSRLDERIANDLRQLPDGSAKLNGIDLGRRAAAGILELRTNDGSQIPEPRIDVEFIPSDQPGKWRQDPISQVPIALGAYWGRVRPFVIRSVAQFPLVLPHPLNSAEYAADFNEVKRLGGDGVVTPTSRTADQTIAGIYWGYDGTPRLGPPPRMYNQIALHIAEQRSLKVDDLARLLALVNVAMADTAIAVWHAKYHYQYWRPVTAIREADGGNPATLGDPRFTPLGAPASNLRGPNFTPPFPAYPSGHAAFGGALFQVLRGFYGTDRIAFTFLSDEFNGVTQDNNGQVRPLTLRSFASLSEAELENALSRIYLGIHWRVDITRGIEVGRRVADYVLKNGLVLPSPI
jgi:hypothetical protein